MQKFIIDAPASVRREVPSAKDHWAIMDASELYAACEDIPYDRRNYVNSNVRFYGATFNQMRESCRTGDASAVAKSDALLSEMSALMPETARRGYHMDVAGAVPCVPTYLSGHPLNMRRRIKTQDEYSPLAIVFDPTCSASLSHSQIFGRGIAVLALVRALAGLRPIELWIASTLNSGDGGGYVAVRIETAPLDLTRAAHYLTSTMIARGVMYSLIRAYHGSTGAFAYRDHELSRRTYRDSCLQAFPHMSDVLAIPSLHAGDELLNDPRGWLRRTFLFCAGQMQEAA